MPACQAVDVVRPKFKLSTITEDMMQILDWIASKRVVTRKSAFLIFLVLLSLPAFSVAQARQPAAQPASGFDTPARDITMTGTVAQLITAHSSGLQLVVDGPQGSFTASLGPHLSSEVRQSLSQGAPVQVSVIQQTINGKQYLLVRKLTVAGKATVVRNEKGFLVHTPSSQRSRASVNPAALYRSAK
jgi:hypothetical protein